jgi:hypothetical protein
VLKKRREKKECSLLQLKKYGKSCSSILSLQQITKKYPNGLVNGRSAAGGGKKSSTRFNS